MTPSQPSDDRPACPTCGHRDGYRPPTATFRGECRNCKQVARLLSMEATHRELHPKRRGRRRRGGQKSLPGTGPAGGETR